MKKVIFGIFAHPDDESFGVSPTILTEIEAGSTVHLITLTDGMNGANSENVENLGDVRIAEWRAAARLMNVHSTCHFGYQDGSLSNLIMLEVIDRIVQLVNETLGEDYESSVEFMSFDENGITGHIDHIVAARATLAAFYRLRTSRGDQMLRVRLLCLPESRAKDYNNEWIYMSPGCASDAIDDIVDGRKYHAKLLEIIYCHKSQQADAQKLINSEGDELGMNYFKICT